jgi:signal transduction histidine kinase
MSSAIRNTLTPKSIKAQLTLWYVLMLGAALAAFAVVVVVARQRELYREADAALDVRAKYLVGSLQAKLLELDLSGALSADALVAGAPVAVRERSGRTIYRSPAFPALGGVDDAIAVNAARNDDALLTVGDVNGEEFRLATIVVKRTGANAIAVQTTASRATVDRTIWQLELATGFWFLLVLAMASWGGAFIAGRALRPVDAIVGRVRAIQASRLSDRLDLQTGSEELDRLVDTLNGMLDRLETSMHGARRFAADASHELQTPLAAMRTALDLCLASGVDTAEEYHVMAAELVVDLDRLSTLIRDLRLLALADAGHLFDRVEDVNLTTIVHECCEIVNGIAEPRGIRLSVDILADVTVRGSVLHLRRALLNLAQNAVRYSPDASTVQITVGRLDEDAVLVIVDEGCGISPDDLPHVFERFYRADPARARDTGGTGLGLAIADQIVRSHGGRIEATSELHSGSTFVVFLPLAAASVPAPDPEALTVNAG